MCPRQLIASVLCISVDRRSATCDQLQVGIRAVAPILLFCLFLNYTYEEHVRQNAVARRQQRSPTDAPSTTEFLVFLIPQKTLLCDRILTDEGVRGDVHLEDFDFDFFPLHRPTLSLSLPDSFRDLYLVGFRESFINADPRISF